MPSALFISPHLDDAVFSCGATIARLVESGHDVTVLTVFTGNVAFPTGFALECQTSKGIAPDADYMALRRAEDEAALEVLGVSSVVHWSFLEAPHRGYDSPPELFAGIRQGDDMWRDVQSELESLKTGSGKWPFDLTFGPQGLGNHADHLQVIRALGSFGNVSWYRDTPYALREPDAVPSLLLPLNVKPQATLFGDATLFQKVAACCAYESQLGFQFDGAMEAARKLTQFHRAEGQSLGSPAFAERFLAPANS